MIFTTQAPSSRVEHALGHIDALRGELRFRLHEPRRWTGSLRRMSMARAVRGSNAIEGYEADLGDVLAEGEGERVLDPRSETAQALAGYRAAMTFVLQLAGDSAFVHHPMLWRSLHFMMTSHDLDMRPGRWRAGQVFVTDERTGDRFYEGPEVDIVPALIDELVEATNELDDVHALVRAAMAHLNLVMIHPFKDGNGRMARCLQSLVLAREGILSPVFCSIEEYLGDHTDAYYRVLADVGAGSWHPERDATPWIEFALLAHHRQARQHLVRIRETEQMWERLEHELATSDVPVRAVAALYDAAQGVRVRNATYRTAHEDPLSDQTASRDLRLLVDAGWLEGEGEKRGRSYRASAKLRRLALEVRRGTEPVDAVDPFSS